jgi:ferredoxin
MRIHIDENLCSGHGRCYTLNPTLFEADDEGYPVQLGKDIDVRAGAEAAARSGVSNCPEGAITVVSD